MLLRIISIISSQSSRGFHVGGGRIPAIDRALRHRRRRRRRGAASRTSSGVIIRRRARLRVPMAGTRCQEEAGEKIEKKKKKKRKPHDRVT